MESIQEAFARGDRELFSNVTINGVVYDDNYISNFKVLRGISESSDFEVGTAFMSTLDLNMIDKYDNFDTTKFKNSIAKVEIGVKTIDNQFLKKKVGEFIIDSATSNGKSLALKGYDLMKKFDITYDCKLIFPTTLKNIVLDICTLCSVEVDNDIKNATGDFERLNHTVNIKPNFYSDTCRTVLAHISELLTAWCYIDVETQKLKISLIKETDNSIKINDSNIISFKEFENDKGTSKIIIDSGVIIQNGADDYNYNESGSHKFYIVDNMFIQGNLIDFDYALQKAKRFNNLSALSIKFNGNPCTDNKILTVEHDNKQYSFLPLNRSLTFDGGLIEEYICPQINYEPNGRRQSLVRHIEKISATLKVLDDKIQSKVGTEEFATLIEQTKEQIKAIAKEINVEGVVKFEDLKKVNDNTIINGGNIKTGVIQSKDGGFGIDLDNKTFFLGRDLENYALLFDGENLKFGTGSFKSENFSPGLKEELKGKDGHSEYLHIRYSDSGGDTGSMYPTPNKNGGGYYRYMGIAKNSSASAPALKSDFTWSKFVGEDGKDGEKGTPGTPGTDGKTPYFHTAWANNTTGDGFSTTESSDKLYIGTYSDYTELDSTDYKKYKWVKIKGEDGENFRYNLISRSDFRNESCIAKKSFEEEVRYNIWVPRSGNASNVIIDENTKVIFVVGRPELEQHIKLDANKKYYIKIRALGRFTLFKKTYTSQTESGSYSAILSLNSTDFLTKIATFTTETQAHHYMIQIDNSHETDPAVIDHIIISDEQLTEDTLWFPSREDSVGEKGEKGDPGPPGPRGEKGTLAELPDALKQWNSNATEISGKYVFTPNLFVGESEVDTKYKTGVYIGENVNANFGGSWRNLSGLIGLKNGKASWVFTADGDFVLGNKLGEQIQLGADGRAIIPTIKSNMIEAGAITSEKIKTGSITTDFLYPGNSERIILESGYPPGSNDCKSIDATGNAIRLKVDATTYIAMWRNGNVDMYSSYSQFFGFNPSYNWHAGNGTSGRGKLDLFGADVYCGWINFYGTSNMSDAREKENIKYLEEDRVFFKNKDIQNVDISKNDIIEFIKNEKIATYNYRKFGISGLSIIAQNTLKNKSVANYLLTNRNDRYAINMYSYSSMIHLALQEEMKKSERLQTEIKTLNDRVNALENIINSLVNKV